MTVFFRTTGTVGGPEFFVRRGARGLRKVRMPVTVAVIERPEGLVLIDAGWSRRTCAWPDEELGTVGRRALGVEVKPEDAIASQIISLGYAPGDVRDVILTHLHRDHAGGVVDLPSATVHLAEREWVAAKTAKAAAVGAWRDYDLGALTAKVLRPYELDGPAVLGFGASRDIFGDGTVLMLDARGHTRGSVAVAVKLDDGWMIHAGDAAMFVEDYQRAESLPPSLYMRAMSWDVAHQRATWHHFREAEAAYDARVVPSHDPERYETLPHTREEGWVTAWEKKKPKKKSKAS